MWRLKKIYATNIVSFRELELDIVPGVATTIFGQNLDNENQKCNGSGKSSIIEAIAFGITGDTLRKVKVEDIINDKADSASVQLVFTNDFNGLMFIVDRLVSRSTPQRVECHLIQDGEEVHEERTVQPSVTEYNKYILTELGITKDELYSSFILCKNHYQSFLDASDKNKKEIINRFSNGAMVDESIEKLVADIQPVQQRKLDAEFEVTKIRGKIEAINDELNSADAKKEEAAKNRESKIEEYKNKIADKRAEIRDHEEKLDKAKQRRNQIMKLDERMQELEGRDEPLEDAYDNIVKEFEALSLPRIKDYVESSKKFNDEILALQNKVESNKGVLSDCMKTVDELEKKVGTFSTMIEKMRNNNEQAERADKKKIAEIENLIEDLKQQQMDIHVENRKESVNLVELEKRLKKLEATLQGAIKCPLCGGEFLFGNDADINDVKNEKSEVEDEIECKEKLIADLESKELRKKEEINAQRNASTLLNEDINKRYNSYRSFSNELATMSVHLDMAKSKHSRVKLETQRCNNDLEAINGKIQNLNKMMFDEVFNTIDGRMTQAKIYMDDINSRIKFAEGQIEQYMSAIEEVKNQKTEDIAIRLEASKRQYEKDLESSEANCEKVRAELEELTNQQDLFMEFKSYLANQKIDAIAAVTNEFLELIGSDIRLQLEGFRKLKSGKIRDKITVKILRNGVDCGAFEKFSGGERARVYLANILAMQKITNSNCEEGKGLELLIEDEILDASDTSGIMSFCDALNTLKATSLLVTQVSVFENYPHTLVVTKRNGESKINV